MSLQVFAAKVVPAPAGAPPSDSDEAGAQSPKVVSQARLGQLVQDPDFVDRLVRGRVLQVQWCHRLCHVCTRRS